MTEQTDDKQMNITFSELRPSNIEFIESEPEILTDFDGFKHTKDDLTADGILTFEAQMRKIKEQEDKQKEIVKEKREKRGLEKTFLIELTRKVIMLCLDKMNKDIMTNTYHLSDFEREKLRKLMAEYNGRDPDDITAEFNLLCKEKLFVDRKDYSNFPVYDN